MEIKGQLVDILGQKIYPALLSCNNGIITSIKEYTSDDAEAEILPFIAPGFIDAHVHIESSMLTPSQFARLAVVHGTVATVSDPHEIANVCGMDGVNFMISDGKRTPFHFYFGAPSCVPATAFETAGARLDANDVAILLAKEDIKYLSEMMNFPGVLMQDAEVMAKIAAAKKLNKPVDGHARVCGENKPGGTSAREFPLTMSVLTGRKRWRNFNTECTSSSGKEARQKTLRH